MRYNVKNFMKIVKRTIPMDEPIYEFGSLQVPEQKPGFADMRMFFPDQEYVGCDMREGAGVDMIMDLHDIDLDDEIASTVLCFDTLEHVENPFIALKEMHRILKPNGIVIISSVMNFPIHDHPSDYWRFTPQAFELILKPFCHSFVGFQGNKKHPHTVVGIGFKSFFFVGLLDLKFHELYKIWEGAGK